jgi:hypothetical protein
MTRISSTKGTGHHIYYSRLKAVLLVILLAVLGGRLAWLAVVGTFSGRSYLVLAGFAALAILLILLLPFVPGAIRALTTTEPVVTLSKDGIHDVRNSPEFVRWQDVGSINLGMRRSNRSYLILTYRELDTARAHAGRAPDLKLVARALTGQGNWHANLRLLKCDREQVLELAKRLQAEEVRQRVLARNGSSKQGWSGQL